MKQTFLFSGVLLLLTACSVPYSGTTGDCTWRLTGTRNNYTLTISGRGAMENYYNLDRSPFTYRGLLPYRETPWHACRNGIKTLILEEGITDIGAYAFANCHCLTSVTIPNSVTGMGTGVFLDCRHLTSVSIGNGVTSIGAYAFRNCLRLASVTIPNGVTGIGAYAFRNCRRLTSVTIPNSVTGIGEGAFDRCSRLTSVTIPGSVTSIGAWAFNRCGGLKEVTVEWTMPLAVNWIRFAFVPLADVILRVPRGTKALYEDTRVWKWFGTIIEEGNAE